MFLPGEGDVREAVPVIKTTAVRQVTHAGISMCVCAFVSVFYQVKARNCRIQKSRARPLFFHCKDRKSTKIKQKTRQTGHETAFEQILTQKAAHSVSTRHTCRDTHTHTDHGLDRQQK